MTISRFLALYLGLAACLPGPALAMAGEGKAALSVAICDDGNEWPPYSYFARVKGMKTEQLSGYSVDVIGEIFARHNVRYTIDLIPWTRCQAVAVLGQRYGMVLNMSRSEARARYFHLSRPYYYTTPFYYYSRQVYPDGLAILSPADLGGYRVCGIQGYNYEGMGFDTGQIDQGAKDFVALVSKLQLGRCALFLEQEEIMSGFAAIGKDYLAGHDIGKAPLPGVKPTPFHFGVSRRHPQATLIRDLIDSELRRMEASGRLAALLRKANQALEHR